MSDADVKKVVYLNKKSDDEAERRHRVTRLKEAFESAGFSAQVTSSAADFEKHAENDGGWPGWCHNVVRRYDIIVVGDRTAGKGNATVVRHALDAGVQVLLWDMENAMFHEVIHVVEVNKKDWLAGWRFQTPEGSDNAQDASTEDQQDVPF